jgi:hypothetical protein
VFLYGKRNFAVAPMNIRNKKSAAALFTYHY